MAKVIHKNGDRYVLQEVKDYSPGVLASKLTNNPLYGGLVSDDAEKTKNAIVYLYVFLAIPVLLFCSVMDDKFGDVGFWSSLIFLCACVSLGWRGILFASSIIGLTLYFV